MQAETGPIRPGEEIDPEALRAFLQKNLNTGNATAKIEQFPAGSSNLTYLLVANGDEFVLRRPPFGNTVKTAHDMAREFRVLSKLSEVYPPAPKPLIYCDDPSVIGSEFYLMERRSGLILRGDAPSAVQESLTLRQEICKGFVGNLAALHRVDHRAAGLGELGRPEGYVRRQIEGWSRRYRDARTDELPDIDKTIAWLERNIPARSEASIIHNDYKFDNVMLNPNDLTEITSVLDWEMVTVGDPLMDLGTTLGYWMSRDAGGEMPEVPFNPRVLMETVSRTDLAEMYADAAGRDISDILFYYVFGSFKIAVIAQQIYARYVRGFTRDARFANFDRFVARLAGSARRAIDSGSI